MWVKAIWDNDSPQNDTELAFAIGDVIYVYEQNGDWYDGELNGVRGFFPASYVEPYENAEEGKGVESEKEVVNDDAKEASIAPSTPLTSSFDSTHESQADPVLEESSGITSTSASSTARTLWAYEAATEHELSFSAEETIYNFRVIDDEWCEGELSDGKFGCFPKSYVEEIVSETPAAPTPSVTKEKIVWAPDSDQLLPSASPKGVRASISLRTSKEKIKKEKSKEDKERKEREKEEREKKEKEERERKQREKEERDKKEKEEKDSKRELAKKDKEEQDKARREAKERQEREKKEREEKERQEREQKKEQDRLFKEEQKRLQEEQKKQLEEQRAAEVARKIKEQEDEIARLREQRDREHLEWEKEQKRLLDNLEETRKVVRPYDPNNRPIPPQKIQKPAKPPPKPPLPPYVPSTPQTPTTPTAPTTPTSLPIEIPTSPPPSQDSPISPTFRPPPPPGRPKGTPPAGPPPKPRKDSLPPPPAPASARPVSPPAPVERPKTPPTTPPSQSSGKLSLSKVPRSISPPPKPTLAAAGADKITPFAAPLFTPSPPKTDAPIRELAQRETSSVRPASPAVASVAAVRPASPATQATQDSPSRVLPPPKPKLKPALPSSPAASSPPTNSFFSSPKPSLPATPGSDGDTWRFKVMFPGKPRPVWVACHADETVATLRAAIADKGQLQAESIVLVFDDAELDAQDVVRVVVKNEAVISVEMQ